ncbi:FecR family protein [Salisaeta longa]|uniref:FecR family protein n=1 Tax=Salisaeta longa TaxID=503170 RepID=UPI0003B4A585|nr:FecR domain-containing protein [Salisaeta longa]
MDPLYETLLFHDALSPEAQDELRERLAADDALAQAFVAWRAARERIATQFNDDLPDRSLLVLYALDAAGQGDLLSEAERGALADARPTIEAALAAHPALHDVVRDIRSACADFEEMWATHAANAPDRANGQAPARDGVRAGRAPIARNETSANRRLLVRWGTGVAMLVVLFAVLYVAPWEPDTTTVRVAEGAQEMVTLADGSTVRLQGAAMLEYVPGDGFDRAVTLSAGQAFFDVKEGRTAFTVTTPTAQTTVLGTQFAVTAEERRTEVILATGRVRLKARTGGPNSAVTLQPGQRSVVARGSEPVPPERVNINDALAWTGLFIFQDAPLATIAQQLSQHYKMPIAVHPKLQSETVTGTFSRSQPAQEVLQALAQSLSAQLLLENNRATIRP